MPTVRRERVVAARPGVVWALLTDPHHQPRWWPKVARVEGVREGRFTQVLTTKAGRQVRADFRTVEREELRRLVWAQELEGTPFAKVFREATTELLLTPEGEGTRVTFTADRKLAGSSRLGGGMMVRKGTRDLLDEALAGLARAVDGPAA